MGILIASTQKERFMGSKTIVFIHGLYMTPLCWEGWVKRFEAKGYLAWHLLILAGREVHSRVANGDAALGRLNLQLFSFI
jgi:hypothetical protein